VELRRFEGNELISFTITFLPSSLVIILFLKKEYLDYVLNPVPHESQPEGRDKGHEGFTLEAFLQSPISKEAGLTMNDIIALRIYTGKGYRFINSALRLAQNSFAATSFTANRAIGKLGKLMSTKTNFPQIYYRGMTGKMAKFFKKLYHKPEVTQGALGRISDPGLFSTTSQWEVATGEIYGGEILFVISKIGGSFKEGQIDENGFERLCTPAPVSWISQYPGEEEYLWPSYAGFVPKIPSTRDGLTANNKEVYEFTPIYLWDPKNFCIGRWKDIEKSELEMLKMGIKLASKGLGLQHAMMGIQMLYIEEQVDEDLEVDEAVSLAFSIFDRGETGSFKWKEAEKLIQFFYEEVMENNSPSEMIERIKMKLLPLQENDGRILWNRFYEHFSSIKYTIF